ncbi:MAG: helix-turn-helix domain-containing protein [Solirubrobacterales bacterium]|nr:helix-turn-helix domain-containing protein [Solirubrobacterales bacterium]
MAATRSRGRQFVQSLERGLDVIRALSLPGQGLTLSDVARETGLTRASARRFLLTLEELGYVRADDRRFALTPRVLELGYAFLSSLSLPQIAQPHLRELVERVHESSSVSVLDGSEIVYVAREPTQRIMTVAISVGTRFPAVATSMGRVLLAGLGETELGAFLARAELRSLTSATITEKARLREEIERVRGQGWALVDQELEAGLRSIAVPIRSPSGEVVAAINLSTQANRRTPAAIRRELLPPLQEAASAIDADLAAGRVP